MKGDANGVTLRFTMPDSPDGMGLNGSLDVYVNDKKVQTVNLTSYYMYQSTLLVVIQLIKVTVEQLVLPLMRPTSFWIRHFEQAIESRIQSSGANGYDYG